MHPKALPGFPKSLTQGLPRNVISKEEAEIPLNEFE
jgi:hypothetical protein